MQMRRENLTDERGEQGNKNRAAIVRFYKPTSPE